MTRSVSAAVSELAEIRREAVKHRPKPPRDGLVLDVGGGQSPHPRADVTLDKYLVDNFERPGEADVDLSKPLVVADGQRIPFADGTFAYSVALHVLEHATDPAAFAAELSRVSPAGFVQVPTRESELTFGWPYHAWYIDRQDDCLVFSQRDERRAPFGDLFHSSYARDTLLRLWWAAHRSRWHHSIEWTGRLQVRVEGQGEADRSARLDVERTVATLESLAARGALKELPPVLRQALRCPLCRSKLVDEPGFLRCSACGNRFPLVGGVPVLVEEAAHASTGV
ncbi:MAG: methyltransferase domain-containing protein [Dehalococcoidia bacterium]